MGTISGRSNRLRSESAARREWRWRLSPFPLTIAMVVWFNWLVCPDRIHSAPASNPAVGIIDLTNRDPNSIHSLTGLWEFYPGRFIDPAEFRNPAGLPRAVPIHVPSRLRDYLSGGTALYHGYATYHATLRLPSPGKHDLAISVPRIQTAHRFFVNGQELSSVGVPGESAMSHHPDVLPKVVLIHAEGDLDLVFHVSNFSNRIGGINSEIEIGPREAVEQNLRLATAYSFTSFGALSIVGLYFVSIFLYRRVEKASLYFGFLCFIVAVRSLWVNDEPIKTFFPDFPWVLYIKIEYLVIQGAIVFFSAYLRNLFPSEYSRRTLLFFFWACGIAAGIVLVTGPATFSYLSAPQNLLALLATTYGMITIIRAFLRKRPMSFMLLFGSSILLAGVTLDVLTNSGTGISRYVSHYAMHLFLVLQGFMLTKRMSTSFNEMDRLSEQLLRMDRMKDEFLSRTSHDLRTPIQGIVGLAQAIREGDAQAPTRMRSLDLIIQSGMRLRRLVDDILDFEKMKNHELRLNLASVPLLPVVDLLFQMNAEAAKKRRIRLAHTIPADFPPLHCDEDRLIQVIQNLLDNALRYAGTGTVRIDCSARDGMAQIAVEDSGPGIPAEYRDVIFEQFEQLSNNDAKGGLGIGLSITRNIVRLMGGDIHVEDAHTAGARFVFTVPLENAVNAGNPITENPPVDKDRTPRIPLLPGWQAESYPMVLNPNGKERILVVEDDISILESTGALLASRDFQVILAADGKTALDLVQHEPPDAMIVDLMIPGISGFDLCRDIRREHSMQELPLMLVTAKVQNSDLLHGVNSGANDYLVKPYDREELLLRVENMIALRRYHVEIKNQKKESRETIERERLRIYGDLHDHIGARLTDLTLIARRMQREPAGVSALLPELESRIQDSLMILRDRLQNLDDLSSLSRDFPGAIHVILLRRYVAADRILRFSACESCGQYLASPSGNRLCAPLFATMIEIASNDLKYGAGASNWSLQMQAENLELTMEGGTGYSLAQNRTGRGTGIIQNRVAEMGGTVQMNLSEQVFSISVRIPVSQNKRLRL